MINSGIKRKSKNNASFIIKIFIAQKRVNIIQNVINEDYLQLIQLGKLDY